MFRKWDKIEGRIVESRTANVSRSERGHRTVQNEYVVEYAVDGGEQQRTKIKQAAYFHGSMKMINPPKGSTVPLLLRRGSGKVKFDADDPRINEKAVYERNRSKPDSAFDDALNG